jgi:hypothetical protein
MLDNGVNLGAAIANAFVLHQIGHPRVAASWIHWTSAICSSAGVP